MYWDDENKRLINAEDVTDIPEPGEFYRLLAWLNVINCTTSERFVLGKNGDPLVGYEDRKSYTIQVDEQHLVRMLSGYFTDIKKARLEHFLEDHPDLEEQYNEFRVLCKLHGFNERKNQNA